ncbi:MAG: ribosome small subunit-dependent GTPase A [Elusimicrobia bacterium]|nr:ribosome small subunit-dependent GTPase A [Elusimicrobiota bacterium]
MPNTRRGDDWSDDVQHEPRPTSSARKPHVVRARRLSPEECNGTVAEIFPNRSAVRLDSRPDVLLCNYRMATLAVRGGSRERSPTCVGDRVRVEGDVIVGACRRRTALARRSPNARNPLTHVMAANLNMLVIVASVREPEYTPGLVSRMLEAADSQDIAVVVCANKIDLLEEGAARPWREFAEARAAVVECSVKSGAGMAELEDLVRGRAAAFCGNSGVGKTSLLRRLLGDDSYGRVAEISAASGKGRHTTTGAVLLPGPANSTWIDTPGVMDFEAVDLKSAEYEEP